MRIEKSKYPWRDIIDYDMYQDLLVKQKKKRKRNWGNLRDPDKVEYLGL